MPCMCGTGRVTADSGSLSTTEITHVQTTWKEVYAEWEDKHGIQFFLRLFQKYPAFQVYFDGFKGESEAELATNDKLKAHVIVFGGALHKLVTSLTDLATATDILHKLCDSHFARGIQENDFKNALNVFAGFLFSTCKLTKDEKNAWTKTTRVIVKVIVDYNTELTNQSKEE